uniref:Uncharacterized protein n=1 Tax=viral metagenome TaxID=1070528 RepID=A0A6C0LGX8_9ZZZZ
MDNSDYQKIMNYFPPVNPNIENVLYEADTTYTTYKATSPLKQPVKGEMYSADILINLRTLRILLNSDITNERFIYELNRLVQSWGPGGYYGKNILNTTLLDLINKVNIKYEKQKELMQEAQQMTLDFQMKQLEDDILGISIKNKSYKKLNVSDLDLSKLGISKNKSIKKK